MYIRTLAVTALCALILVAPTSARPPKKEGLTALQAVETARLMKNPEALGPGNTEGLVSLSPDRKRYVMRVVKGDAKANGVWIEFFAGDLLSLDTAAAPVPIVKTFSSGLGTGGNVFGAIHDVEEYSTPLRWLDNDRFVFLSSTKQGVRQVASISLTTRALEFLTDHPTNVVSFDIAAGGSIFYSAQASPRAFDTKAALKAGYTVPTTTDAMALFRGDLSGSNIFENAWATQWFVKDVGGAIRQIKLFGRDRESMYGYRVSWSPDGKSAILSAEPNAVPADWALYKQREMAARVASLLRANSGDSLARTVNQHLVVDAATGAARPLWNAATMIGMSQVVWSPDAKSVLIAPAFLPPNEDDSTLFSGDAAAIVDVATGKHVRLPIKMENPLGVAGLRWIDATHAEIDTRKGPLLTRTRFKKEGKAWVADGAPEPLTAGSAISLQLRQDMNTPPKLFAVDGATKDEKLVLDFNPALAAVALGKADKVESKTASGLAWSGMLFYPPGYDAKKRYPLLIQSVYGTRVENAFTLYGLHYNNGLGPTPIAMYPGRALAARGVLVLNFDMANLKMGTPEEGAARQQGFEAAIAHLDGLKLIDPAKVGIIGFSRNGFYVEYTLTHSAFPFAAAISADNWDPSYIQQTLTGTYASALGPIGSEPFGAGLAAWLQTSPGFNTERIKAPLMMVDQSIGLYGVFSKWETFNRLRYLKRPVEFYVMPDAEAHGSHNTQNPAQVLALMNRSIDWFDFWLNGREDKDPAKAAQYAEWRKLRALQSESLKTPRPPLLEWKATPKP